MSEAMARDYLANKERVKALTRDLSLAQQEIETLKQANALKGEQLAAADKEIEWLRQMRGVVEQDRDRFAALLEQALTTAKKRSKLAAALDNPILSITTKIVVPALTVFLSR